VKDTKGRAIKTPGTRFVDREILVVETNLWKTHLSMRNDERRVMVMVMMMVVVEGC